MKTPVIFALSTVFALAAFHATAAERACRPSLSNAYKCPDSSASPKVTKPVERACRPSLSNLWHCPEPSESRRRVAKPVERRAPSASTEEERRAPRRSPEGLAAREYATETQARAHCPSDTVVWANTRSNIYHFRGTANYGNTKSGAYMCEPDSISAGMRAAKNETHP
jgi:hypothetical protein